MCINLKLGKKNPTEYWIFNKKVSEKKWDNRFNIVKEVKDEDKQEKFYSILSNLLNSLEDDLQLDLGKGENGYKTYEDSYKAVKKYTLRQLRKALCKVKDKSRGGGK